jgi:DNA mismatch repair protein MutL
MGRLIQLLPEHVANQIAAGEVIQRPSSAVKELLENAVDAGASKIDLVIKDAGKSLIQVIDNGIGMNIDDANICFQRHATSKIKSTDDLYAINTKGFRGEALASIAAVAQVELKTKTANVELGIQINIEGSEILSNEPISCPVGTNILMKNLFFNVPARRNFLKSNAVETKHIIDEFERIALAHPGVHFTMYNNDNLVFDLPKATNRQRIINIFGKKYNERLVPLEEKTSITEISGFILKPESSKKTRGEQFFFVNDRFIKNTYLNHAVRNAYKELISKDQFPSYFIYLTVPKDSLDINIHPTKTEVKFQDDRSIYAIVLSTVKNSLGKYSISPSLDFEQESSFQVPPLKKGEAIKPPTINVNPNYNPFEKVSSKEKQEAIANSLDMIKEPSISFDQNLNETSNQTGDSQLEQNWTGLTKIDHYNKIFQFKRKYIVTSLSSGIILIDQERAHHQIVFERLLQQFQDKKIETQQLAFPLQLELSNSDYELSLELLNEIKETGIDIDDFGNNTLVINGLPMGFDINECKGLIEDILENFKQNADELISNNENLAWTISKRGSIKSGRDLNNTEMDSLINELFCCDSPYFNFKGKPIIIKLENQEIDSRFEKK